ncbi:MAG: hypothetical protein KKC27_11855, partial [Gammaproteobacteria bacterium]|nr:hypothetical protein [Gammaproteobacteria bacterium]
SPVCARAMSLLSASSAIQLIHALSVIDMKRTRRGKVPAADAPQCRGEEGWGQVLQYRTHVFTLRTSSRVTIFSLSSTG